MLVRRGILAAQAILVITLQLELNLQPPGSRFEYRPMSILRKKIEAV
jgi:hypothetical protein